MSRNQTDNDEMPRERLPIPEAPHEPRGGILDNAPKAPDSNGTNENDTSVDVSQNAHDTAPENAENVTNAQILPLGAGLRIPHLDMKRVEEQQEGDNEAYEEEENIAAGTEEEYKAENITAGTEEQYEQTITPGTGEEQNNPPVTLVDQQMHTLDQTEEPHVAPQEPQDDDEHTTLATPRIPNGAASTNDTIQIQVNQLEQLIEMKMDRLKEDLLQQLASQHEEHKNTTTVTHLKQKTIRVQLSPSHRVAAQNVVPPHLDPKSGKKKTPPRFDASPRGVHITSAPQPHKRFNEALKNGTATNDDDASTSSDDDSEDLSPRIREEKTKFETIFEEALARCYDRLRDVLGLNPTKSDDEWRHADETKWLRELYVYLKEENIHLRDALTIREGQIKLLQNSIQNLSRENKEGLKTIQDLKRKLGFQNRLLKKQIQQVEIERNHSPEVLIPALVQKMKHLDASPRRSFDGQRNATPHNTPTTPTGSAHSFSVMQQKIFAAERDSLSPPSRSSLDGMPLKNSPPISSPISLNRLPTHHETQLVPRMPSARRVKNSPRLSARSVTTPPPDTLTSHERKKMDKLAGRLMKSLQGSTTVSEEAERVDAKMEEIQHEFESRGQALPLRRIGDCMYQLGRRRLNLYLSGNQLNVKSGGGSQPLLSVLHRHMAASRQL